MSEAEYLARGGSLEPGPLRLVTAPASCVLCGWNIHDEARQLELGLAHVECAADRSGGVMRGGR